jgi:hypothetical protein
MSVDDADESLDDASEVERRLAEVTRGLDDERTLQIRQLVWDVWHTRTPVSRRAKEIMAMMDSLKRMPARIEELERQLNEGEEWKLGRQEDVQGEEVGG